MRTTLVALLALVTIGHAEEKVAEVPKVVRLEVMTWYHPLLEPGLAGITLLTTVVAQSQTTKTPGVLYWNVRLRIDETIFVAPRFAKKLQGIKFVDSGDYRERKIGDRIVIFAGLGEPYFGDDFMLPCWSGTTTDLGILLHKSDADEASDNEQLLSSLRTQAKVSPKDRDPLDLLDDLDAFAAFCPRGEAHSLIQEKRHAEMKKIQEIDGSENNAPKTKSAEQPGAPTGYQARRQASRERSTLNPHVEGQPPVAGWQARTFGRKIK
jgi:hypothetical protein